LWFSSGLLAAYYGPDWPGITALLAVENGYMQFALLATIIPNSEPEFGITAIHRTHIVET